MARRDTKNVLLPVLLFILGMSVLLIFGLMSQEIRCGMGHQYKSWSKYSAPTCTTKGEERRICKVCSSYDKRIIPELKHTEVVDEAVAPDCVHDGKTEGRHCSVCNKVIEEQEIIPALGHDKVLHAEVPPTFFENGLAEYMSCNRCDHVEGYEVLDSLGSQGLKYSIDWHALTCTVTGIGKRDDWNIYIPATYDGVPVVGIDSKAFAECTNLESVIIQDGIEYIGEEAFKNCVNLKSITIPNSVTYIGEGAFLGCDSLEDALFNNPSGWEYDGRSIDMSSPYEAAKCLKGRFACAWYKV